MDASSSGRRKRQESSNSLAGFGGSDDEDDPHKRKRMAVSKSCGDKSLSLVRELVLQIVAESQDETVRAGLNNPGSRPLTG